MSYVWDVADDVSMRLEVALDTDADAAEFEDETALLRSEILELDVASVQRPSGGPAPEGTRAGEVAVVGTLLVGAGKEMIVPLIRAIEAWVTRRRVRSVKLTLEGDSIEVSNASSDDQRRMIEAFISRHARTDS
jgi:hypothetical protein